MGRRADETGVLRENPLQGLPAEADAAIAGQAGKEIRVTVARAQRLRGGE